MQSLDIFTVTPCNAANQRQGSPQEPTCSAHHRLCLILALLLLLPSTLLARCTGPTLLHENNLIIASFSGVGGGSHILAAFGCSLIIKLLQEFRLDASLLAI